LIEVEAAQPLDMSEHGRFRKANIWHHNLDLPLLPEPSLST